MNKRQKIFASIFVFAAVFGLGGGRAEAAKNYDGETHAPTEHRELCKSDTPVDFSAYPSDIGLDLTTGVMSYNINVKWASCNSTDTRAYAIFSIGQEICPISGSYGASNIDNGIVTDCVKYVGSPPYQGPGNGLKCTAGAFGVPGTNEKCVALNFAGVRREENQPSGTSSAVIPMQSVIPNWSSQQDTGSWTIGNAMCQFYKTGSNFTNYFNDRCVNVSMTVKWKGSVVKPTLSCGALTTTPGSPEQNETFSVQSTFNLNGSVGLSGQTSYTVTLNFPDAGVNNRVIAANQPINWSGSVGSATLDNLSISALGEHTASYKVDVVGANNSPQTCNGSLLIVKKPYVSFYNGDVFVGGSFAGQGSCDKQSTISTFTKDGFRGSGVQFAAFALGTINNFNSARLRSSDPLPPNGLNFSNTVTPNGKFGIYRCMPNYFDDTKYLAPNTTETSIDVGSLSDGNSFYKNSNFTLSGSISGNKRIRLFVDGDLRITDNIEFADNNWNSVKDIPAFQLIVKGNIYIESRVTKLNGLYIAQPTAGAKGEIITCVNPGENVAVPIEDIYSDCGSKLTVDGSFVAKKVLLIRSSGSLNDATDSSEKSYTTSNAGEVFTLGPQNYLAVPKVVPGSSGQRPGYDYFSGLPPLL